MENKWRILGQFRNHMKKAVVVSMICMSMSTAGSFGGNQEVVMAQTQDAFTNRVPVFQIQKRKSKKVVLEIETEALATYYKIYRSTTVDGTYKYIGTTYQDTFTDSSVTASKTYYYRIKAFQNDVQSKYSKKIKVGAALGKVKGLEAKQTNSGVALSWSELKGAKKYRIYRASSENGSYQYISSTSSRTFTDSSVNSGSTYYYKVRGSKTLNGIVYYGAYSAVRKSVSENSSTNDNFVDEVIRLVNIERQKNGLSSLTTNQTLTDAAYERAVETKTLFSHTRPDGTSCFTVFEQYGISYRAVGENIAYGQKDPEAVMDAWMNSEGHRANILSSNFGKIGIGCYYSNGTYYWTQLFMN